MLSVAVCCLFLLALAVGNDPVRASGATRGLPTDDKVAIVLKPSALVFGSCPKLPAPTMNVRLQALKAKSGAIFRRKVVTDDEFTCLANLGSQPLTASSIQKCSEQTQAAGLKMFRWDGGLCTGYTNGIPPKLARCAGAGSVVLYSVDVPAISQLVSNITFALSGNLMIDAAWDVTHTNSCFSFLYRVSFNNLDTLVSDKLATVSLDKAPPCAEYPLTVTPVDANSAMVGPAVTAKVVVPKALELSLNLTQGVTAVKASWRAEYTCNPNKEPCLEGPNKEPCFFESYLVTSGYEYEYANKSTFEFIFTPDSDYCSDTASTLASRNKTVNLQAFNDANFLLQEVNENFGNTSMPGHRYPSLSKYCFYYQTLAETPGGVGLTYNQLLDFCLKTMLSGLNVDQESLDTYIAELAWAEAQTPNVVVGPHYLGVKKNSTSGKWMWLSGSELTVPSPNWDSGEPGSAGDCVQLNAKRKLAAVSCDATNMATVCLDYYPE